MSYGSPEWSPWVLEEEEAIKHIKTAYVLLEDFTARITKC